MPCGPTGGWLRACRMPSSASPHPSRTTTSHGPIVAAATPPATRKAAQRQMLPSSRARSLLAGCSDQAAWTATAATAAPAPAPAPSTQAGGEPSRNRAARARILRARPRTRPRPATFFDRRTTSNWLDVIGAFPGVGGGRIPFRLAEHARSLRRQRRGLVILVSCSPDRHGPDQGRPAARHVEEGAHVAELERDRDLSDQRGSVVTGPRRTE